MFVRQQLSRQGSVCQLLGAFVIHGRMQELSWGQHCLEV